MADWQEAPDLRDLAQRVIAKREDVSHVDPCEVLFLWENETKPKADGGRILGRCYGFRDHPIGAFTGARYAIVFYRQHMDWMNERQLAILMWHELKHIPEKGNKLAPHDVQDFHDILRAAGLDWNHQGEEVPDILAD